MGRGVTPMIRQTGALRKKDLEGERVNHVGCYEGFADTGAPPALAWCQLGHAWV